MNDSEIATYHDQLGACLAMAAILASDLENVQDPDSWMELDRASRLYENLVDTLSCWDSRLLAQLGMEDEI